MRPGHASTPSNFVSESISTFYVIPLLYDEAQDHQALHQTLAKWAECHRNGLLGKESIIRNYGSTKRPIKPFDNDPVVSQVVWAISEPTGHNAQVFANLNPVPPFEWLEVFAERGLLGTAPLSSGKDLQGLLVDGGHRTSRPAPLHPITKALGYWLSRHLDQSALLDWIFRSGSSLHADFREAIRQRLTEDSALPSGLGPVWQILTSEPTLVWMNIHRYFALLSQLSSGRWNLKSNTNSWPR